MDASLIAILAVGVSLAALILTGQRSMRAEVAALRTELRDELRDGLAAASAERQAIRRDVQSLTERVARLEGAIPFLSHRQASSPPPASAA